MITTASSHFGIAPSIVQPDDSIFIILGCSIPMILRHVHGNGYYEVVGECYVEGFTKGECMTDLDNGKHEIQDIILY